LVTVTLIGLAVSFSKPKSIKLLVCNNYPFSGVTLLLMSAVTYTGGLWA
jgi:hypothetical protein